MKIPILVLAGSLSVPLALGVVPRGATAQGTADPAALERRAEERFAVDDLEAAAELYRQLAQLQSEVATRARTLVKVAWIEHLVGRDVPAIHTLTEALQLDPQIRFRADLYSESFRPIFVQGRERAEILLDQAAYEAVRKGLEALRARDLAAARSHLEEALEIRPRHVEALYNLALVDVEEDRPDAAQAGFEKILSLDATPSVEVSDDLRGRCWSQLGRLANARQLYTEAEEVLLRAIEIRPEEAPTWVELGFSRQRRGLAGAAAEAFARAAQLRPDDPLLAEHLGQALLDAERWDDALRHLEAARARHAERARLAFQLGLAHLGRGDAAAAARAFEAVLGLDEGDRLRLASPAALRLARHFRSTGDLERSLAMADRARGWRPEAVDAWILRGLALADLDRLEDARQALEEARRLAPERADVHNQLGFVELELGRLDDAEVALRRALELDSQLAAARANLEALEAARAQGSRRPHNP